ncbi:MAG: preprotein translocase subunit SecY [Candidatus Woesearchaeota archaeon]
MSLLISILKYIPEVRAPTEKKLSFKQKLKWTALVLVLFFILGAVPLYGLGANALSRFEFLSVVLGASFGSLISLGIGPIVTASIVLQLLTGAGILGINLTTHEGKAKFQGLQKLLTYFFIILESMIYVLMGGLSPEAGISPAVLIIQLCIGALIIVYLDELMSKWGFGSGVSLFIAAGVSQSIFIQALSPLHPVTNGVVDTTQYIGKIPQLFYALSTGNPTSALLSLSVLVATVVIFLVVVFAQAMKVEIPLSFGRIRGHGIRWPLNFIYTSVIPVILVSALIANIQLLARLVQNAGITWLSWLGTFSGSQPIGGLAAWLVNVDLLDKLIKGNFVMADFAHAGVYTLIMILGSVIFSWFWMQTSGLDPRAQAKQMMASGLQIPGFRKDARVLERLLKRYIYPLTIMGGIFIGLLASIANLTNALGSGTGLLLTVMIVYKLYEDIAKQHIGDMNPALRKMMGK